MTETLQDTGYFASFNNPMLEEIREYLGYTNAEKGNPMFSYQGDPRY